MTAKNGGDVNSPQIRTTQPQMITTKNASLPRLCAMSDRLFEQDNQRSRRTLALLSFVRPERLPRFFLFFFTWILHFSIERVTTTLGVEDDEPCSHRASRMHLPRETRLAMHISAHPLLNLTCRWPAVRKHSSTTGHRLPFTSWIYTHVPFLNGGEYSRRDMLFMKRKFKVLSNSGNNPVASSLLKCIRLR